jgi:hypothetical protein
MSFIGQPEQRARTEAPFDVNERTDLGPKLGPEERLSIIYLLFQQIRARQESTDPSERLVGRIVKFHPP